MPVRVVIDTCVWVAAIRSKKGASYRVLSLIGSERFDFGISVALYLEYKQSLLRTAKEGATALSDAQVDAVLAALAHFADEVPVYYTLRPNLRDPNDDMVFECAAHYGASHIVTFNTADFAGQELPGYGIQAIRPARFLEMLEE